LILLALTVKKQTKERKQIDTVKRCTIFWNLSVFF